MELKKDKGRPYPLGASFYGNGINFAIVSRHGTEVNLRLYDPEDQKKLIEEISLHPRINRTGDVWHIYLEGLPSNLLYSYSIDGPHGDNVPDRFDETRDLIDPYAQNMGSSIEWGHTKEDSQPYRALCWLPQPDNFDWQNVESPRIPIKDLVIYEMHVRGFTIDPSSGVSKPGTYLGLVDKIPYLKELGVNCVELLPIFEFDEKEIPRQDAEGNPLTNFWGYSTINFYAPMNRYASDKTPGKAKEDLKTLIRELHRNKIEVILDVVFNHTAEGNEGGPILSFKGLDNPTYYLLDKKFNYLNFSGCGNTFNCNHPVTLAFIVSCLRYWVTEYRVDGFRFDLASVFYRGRNGEVLSRPPIVDAISEDPILAKTKLIAEPWDAAGIYQVGGYYPQADRWSEWNGKYRDSVRRFVNNLWSDKGEFATRLSGSQDLYGYGRSPSSSINFITIHDGFTLKDLVSYNGKHNEANGEENRDGSNDNYSWNCGAEGETDDPNIIALRNRQMRNFFVALLTSQGVPMLMMGDEYGHTKNGNNNTYCQEGPYNYFLWDQLEANKDLFRFVSKLIQYRKRHNLFHRRLFLSEKSIEWHGKEPYQPAWNENNGFLAFCLVDDQNGNDLYVAFNTCPDEAHVKVPIRNDDKFWHLIVDTGAESPNDIIDEDKSKPLSNMRMKMLPFSTVILKALP